MAENGKDLPIVNFEKISDLISMFKLPLMLTVIGIILTVFSLVLINKSGNKEQGIVFSSSASDSASIKSQISVDIEGGVDSPGVYQFEDGKRIEDAILKAGGLTNDADLAWIEKNMNKAAKLVDGGKIYIPSLSEGKNSNVKVQMTNSESNTLGVITGLININSASQSELESLPGVGPVTAVKIIEGRPYQTLEELKTKKSIGSALYDKIKVKLTI